MHTVSATLKARVTAKINECIKKAGVTLPPVNVRYDINSARLGGQANYAKNTIRINPVFLNAYTDHYIDQTVTHEAAHLIARAKYGRFISAHGPEWKRVMVDLGVRPDRCHSYQVPAGLKVGKQTTKHSCSCERCGHQTEVGSKVANKIKAGAVYRHRGCGGKIVLPLKLSGTMVAIPTATARAHTVKTPAQTKVAAPAAPGSKLDICRRLWKDHNSLAGAGRQSRATMIDLFVRFAGCTPAGAATYFSKLNKE